MKKKTKKAVTKAAKRVTVTPVARGAEYAPSSRIASREIEGQILVLLPDDMEIYTFNAAGALIWKGLARGRGQSRIVADVMRAFGIDRPRAEADVARFIRDMARKGLLAKTR